MKKKVWKIEIMKMDDKVACFKKADTAKEEPT